MKLGRQYPLPSSDPVSPQRLFLPCSGSGLHFCFHLNRQEGSSPVSSVSHLWSDIGFSSASLILSAFCGSHLWGRPQAILPTCTDLMLAVVHWIFYLFPVPLLILLISLHLRWSQRIIKFSFGYEPFVAHVGLPKCWYFHYIN